MEETTETLASGMAAVDAVIGPDASAEAVADTQADNRGRFASAPWQIPWRGWRDVLLRVKEEAALDNLQLIAAGMAFYAMLSVAPALAVIISVYGLLTSPEALTRQMVVLSSYLPDEARALVEDQLAELMSTAETNLGWGLVASAMISLWSASRAMKSLFGGLNAVYDERETRGWFWLTLQSVTFTLAGILLLVLTLATLTVVPLAVDYLPISNFNAILIRFLSTAVVSLVVLAGLAVLYRYGPSRTRAHWRWVIIGALVAWVTWIAASGGLSWYVSNFDSYQRTYGALGAVAILLMWFFVSAYAMLLGGELNAELEHQTQQDSTVGPEQPMGERGAVMADQLGAIPRWRKRKLAVPPVNE